MRCSEPKQPPRLSKVFRLAFAVAVHGAEHGLRAGFAYRDRDRDRVRVRVKVKVRVRLKVKVRVRVRDRP